MDFGVPLEEDELWRAFRDVRQGVEGDIASSSSSAPMSGFWRAFEALERAEAPVGVRGCTMEVQLRRMTSLYACSTFDVWTFLLRLRSYADPKQLLLALLHRFSVAASGDCPHTVAGCVDYLEAGGDAGTALRAGQEAMADACATFGEQSSAADDADSTGAGTGIGEKNMLEISVLFPSQVSIVMFVEIWVASFPEDFLPDSLEGINLRNPAVDAVVAALEEGNRGSGSDEDMYPGECDVMDVLCRFLMQLDGSDVLAVGAAGAFRHIERLLKSILVHQEEGFAISYAARLPLDDSGGGSDGSGSATMRLPAIAEASMAARRCIASSASADETAFPVLHTASHAALAVGRSHHLRRCGSHLRMMLMMRLGEILQQTLRPVMVAYSDLAATLAVTELQSLASNLDDMAERSASGRMATNVRLFNSAVDKMFISLPKAPEERLSSELAHGNMDEGEDDDAAGGMGMSARGEDFQERLSFAFEKSRSDDSTQTRRRLSGRVSVGHASLSPGGSPSRPRSSPAAPLSPSSSSASPSSSTPPVDNPFEMELAKDRWRPGFFMRRIGRRLSGGSSPTKASAATAAGSPADPAGQSSALNILLDFDAADIAKTLTLRLHYLFSCIPLSEFIVNPGFSYDNETRNDYNSVHASTPFLHRLRRESERIQVLLVSEVLSLAEVCTRAEAMTQLVLVGEHLARARSHHALVMVASTLQSQAVFRLKASWAIVERAIPGRWARLGAVMGLGGSKLVQGLMDALCHSGLAVGPDLRASLVVPAVFRGTALEAHYTAALQFRGPVAEEKKEGVDYAGEEEEEEEEKDTKEGVRESVVEEGFKSPPKAAALFGLPRGIPVHMACMPFVNGFITRLLRTNQASDYVDCADGGPAPLMNAAKASHTALLIATLRCCQLTAYQGTTEPRILKLLLKPVVYATEDEQWARSLAVEVSAK